MTVGLYGKGRVGGLLCVRDRREAHGAAWIGLHGSESSRVGLLLMNDCALHGIGGGRVEMALCGLYRRRMVDGARLRDPVGWVEVGIAVVLGMVGLPARIERG